MFLTSNCCLNQERNIYRSSTDYKQKQFQTNMSENFDVWEMDISLEEALFWIMY